VVTVSHLLTSPIFAGKDGSLPLSVKLHEGLHDIQHNDIQQAFRVMGLFATCSLNDIQHNVFSFIMPSVVMLSIAIT
jgi:hypothetical protein